MMKWIDIEAFRGLEDLRLDGLGRINLLLGPNNSGKTSVLEAISLLLEPERRQSWERAAGFRGAWPFPEFGAGRRRVQDVEWLFPHAVGTATHLRLGNDSDRMVAGVTRLTGMPSSIDPAAVAALSSLNRTVGQGAVVGAFIGSLLGAIGSDAVPLGQEQRGLRIDVDRKSGTANDMDHTSIEIWERGAIQEQGAAGTALAMLSSFSHRHDVTLQLQVSALIKASQKASIVKLLGRVAPGIVDLHILTDDDRGHGIFIEHEAQGFVPLSTFGDGMRRTLHFAAGVLQARGGTLLIDEIEIAIHTSVIGAVFDWLVDACVDNDVQLFVTTHSLEAVDAILEGRRESLDDIVSYRLEGGRLKKRLGGERLHRLRYKMASEVRG